MIRIEDAKVKAEKIAYGNKVVFVRAVDNYYLIQLGSGDRNSSSGYTVLVEKETGEAEIIALYSSVGLDLLKRSEPV